MDMDLEDDDGVFITQTLRVDGQNFSFESFGDDVEILDLDGNKDRNTLYSDISDAEENDDKRDNSTIPTFD